MNEYKFVKIFDKELSDYLKSNGFVAIKEQLNNEDVYVFENTEEIIDTIHKYLNSNYSMALWVYGDSLSF